MPVVTDLLPHQILSPDEGPAAEVMNADGGARICLVCEHASPMIPAGLAGLGLAREHRDSHAVWDPGAGDLARSLSHLLDAPLVTARVSRLVYDCNRPPERADAMPERTETIDIPGNRGLTPEERVARTREIYDAFHQTLTDTLDRFARPPAIVTLHSFTPVWYGQPRATEVGLLHDASDRMAKAMLKAAAPRFATELNQPYSAADGVTHLLARHATARGLDSVMIEVRNDLLRDAPSIKAMAEHLHPMIIAAQTEMGVT